MKKYLMIILLMHIGSLQAQNPDTKRTWHWYFGNGAGIDFSSGMAVADTNGHLHTWEGCASISDTSGNLLFYTDGDTVWDRNHNMMPNGYGLMGCGQYGSSAQAAVIIPHPGNEPEYYIITTDCIENSGISGVRFTLINMLANGGNGDVDTTQKNIVLFAPTTESLAVTMNCNKKDYWIVAHEFNNNNFRVYSLDSLGINMTPQIISIGSPYTYHRAMLKFSSDGEKLATAYQNINIPYDQGMLFDFDTQNGIIYNGIQLAMTFGGAYSPEFSFDNSKLYYNMAATFIVQYDISSGIDSVINSSKNNIAFDLFSTLSAMNKGADGKIYIGSLNFDSISTIDSSNLYGANCNFNYNSFFLNRHSNVGLPSFVSNYFFKDSLKDDCIINGQNPEIEKEKTAIFPNPADKSLNILGKNINVITIADLKGKIVCNKVGNLINEHQMDISAIENGIYFISIYLTDGKKLTSKLLINR